MDIKIIALIAIMALILCIVGVSLLKAKSRTRVVPEPETEADIYTATPLLNNAEIHVMALLDEVVKEVFGPRARVFAQVSYGEFLKSNTRSAFAKVNQKRADFVVANLIGEVTCVVEYQG